MEHLEGILASVLEMGYASTWIILAVLVLRCMLKRAPKRYSYLLWAIPAVRLLIPIPFSGIWGMLGSLPIGSLGKTLDQAVGFLGYPEKIGALLAEGRASGGMLGLAGNGEVWNKAVQAGIRAVSRAAELARGDSGIGSSLAARGTGTPGNVPVQSGSVNPGSLMEAADAPLSFMQAAAILWAVGAVLYVGWNIISYIRLKRELLGAVRWEGNVYFADGIPQPFVLAGFPDKVYLPSSLGRGEAANILRHEQVHVRRKDPWLNLLAVAILGVYWFHPLVWAGVHYFRRDMEMSCDEAAVAGLDEAGLKGYIMDMLRFSVSRDQWQQFPCGFGKKGAVERAINLKNAKSRTKASLWLAGAVVAAAAIILIPNAQSASRSGSAQELAGRDSGNGLSGIGNAIQAVGAEKEKSFQEAFQEAESKAREAESRAREAESRAREAESKAREAETPEELSELQGEPEGQGQQEAQPLQEFLEQYFTELYRALSDDAIDFSHEDFASINGYIVGKELISQRVSSNILLGGIHNVKIREVNIGDISKNGTEAEVYVKHEWTYGITPRHIEGMGTGYRVSLASNGNGYQVLDLEGDSKDCIQVKEAIVLNSISKEDIETDYGAVDDFYEDYEDSIQRMKEEQDKLEHK